MPRCRLASAGDSIRDGPPRTLHQSGLALLPLGSNSLGPAMQPHGDVTPLLARKVPVHHKPAVLGPTSHWAARVDPQFQVGVVRLSPWSPSSIQRSQRVSAVPRGRAIWDAVDSRNASSTG